MNAERHSHRLFRLAATGAFLLATLPGNNRAAEPAPASAILQELRSFDTLGSVLYVAAHPDDENTQLIAYLARGRHYRTAYLSLTRGDGGQNVLGPEFGEELGVIRTQELLAARRIDGGRQFFTRAIDFGYSKDYKETLRIWNRQEVLSDVVRVIRTFRPDVIITRFSPEPGRTHGHHTASAVLALEAFRLAGDSNAFPDQLRSLAPWQPKRILWNGFNRGFGGEQPGAKPVRIEVGGNDPVSGESFAEIAAHSRSMHKTQGFGNFTGYRGAGGPRTETFQLLAGEPATNDILDGVNTTWGRIPGGVKVEELTGEIIAKFNADDPAASVGDLLKLKKLAIALPSDPLVNEKRRQLDDILRQCLGLTVTTTLPRAEVVAGEALRLHEIALLRSSVVPVRWLGARYPSIGREVNKSIDLHPGQEATREATETLPANTPVSQPYWLRGEHTTGTYRVDDPSLIGRPENPPVFPIEQVFDVEGQQLIVPDQPVQPNADPDEGETTHLAVIPPVELKLQAQVELFAPEAARPVTVQISADRPGLDGVLRLDAPTGWKITPETQHFHLGSVGERTNLSFTVTAPTEPSTAAIIAQAQVGGKSYDNERVVIHYSHIPLQLLQPPARMKAVCLRLSIAGTNVGYIPGAGDSVAQSLEDMGCAVTNLSGADLTLDRLHGLDAVVIGIRAFNVRDDLAPHLKGLFDYVQAGGTVIVQYNRPRGLKTRELAPYDLRLSNDRVTDEDSPVTFLAPEHPALNTPNKISSADFQGWVQERGVYFPDQWDEHFTPLIACNDPGEAPLKGSLLVAKYGRGYYVYTGLDWFRELPSGVPGAYRLFANLVSLGKADHSRVAGGSTE